MCNTQHHSMCYVPFMIVLPLTWHKEMFGTNSVTASEHPTIVAFRIFASYKHPSCPAAGGQRMPSGRQSLYTVALMAPLIEIGVNCHSSFYKY